MFHPRRNQSGFVLVTGMIILIVVAIAGIASMEISNLDYKMSTNSAFKDQSFQASETGRIAVGDAVHEFIYERSWDNITIHTGITKDNAYDPLASNGDAEDLFDDSTLIKDMGFTVASTNDIEAIDADIYIIKADSASTSEGSGLQQLSGYRGAGKGAASSGAALFFELRSKGKGKGGAETITAAEYRTFIQ